MSKKINRAFSDAWFYRKEVSVVTENEKMRVGLGFTVFSIISLVIAWGNFFYFFTKDNRLRPGDCLMVSTIVLVLLGFLAYWGAKQASKKYHEFKFALKKAASLMSIGFEDIKVFAPVNLTEEATSILRNMAFEVVRMQNLLVIDPECEKLQANIEEAREILNNAYSLFLDLGIVSENKMAEYFSHASRRYFNNIQFRLLLVNQVAEGEFRFCWKKVNQLARLEDAEVTYKTKGGFFAALGWLAFTYSKALGLNIDYNPMFLPE